MAEVPVASVIVLGMNSKKYLEECLGSIIVQKAPDFEIIYVDNASADDSVSFVKKQFPQVRVVQNDTNSGYAGGNNLGAKNASGKYVVFVNPDTVALEGWLSALISFLEKGKPEKAIGCSKILLHNNPNVINSVGLFASVLGFSGSLGDGDESSRYAKPMRLFAPTGCSFAIKREVFQSLGGFDEDFFMYEEDMDLGWRAANRGIESWFVPESRILHKYIKFAKKEMPYFQTARNRIWMIRKNENSLFGRLLLINSVLFSLALSFGMLLLLSPRISLAIIKGILEGLLGSVQPDKYANGPGNLNFVGIKQSLKIFYSKFRKHFL